MPSSKATKQSKTSTQKVSSTSSSSTPISHKILKENSGIITGHPQESSKYICLVCRQATAKYSSGKWDNCVKHLTSSKHLKSIARIKKGAKGEYNLDKPSISKNSMCTWSLSKSYTNNYKCNRLLGVKDGTNHLSRL